MEKFGTEHKTEPWNTLFHRGTVFHGSTVAESLWHSDTIARFNHAMIFDRGSQNAHVISDRYISSLAVPKFWITFWNMERNHHPISMRSDTSAKKRPFFFGLSSKREEGLLRKIGEMPRQ